MDGYLSLEDSAIYLAFAQARMPFTVIYHSVVLVTTLLCGVHQLVTVILYGYYKQVYSHFYFFFVKPNN